MAHKCNIANLYGAIQAKATIDQGPIFKNGNINKSSSESQLTYASIMNNNASKQVSVNIKKASIGSGELAKAKSDLNAGRTAEALVPEKVYARIDKQMESFRQKYTKSFLPQLHAIEKKYAAQLAKAPKDQKQAILDKINKESAPIRGKVEALYKEEVAPRFTEAKEQLQSVYDNAGNNTKKLDARLKAMGLTREGAYYAHEYFKYLENGGPYFNINPGGGSKLTVISDRITNLTKNKTSFNPMTATYNVGELATKAPATFGFEKTLKGIVKAHEAAQKHGLSIIDRLPQLEKEGIYESDISPLRPQGKLDFVARSQNLLDNAAYFIGKEAGDVSKAMKEIAYRPKPWNDTFLYHDTSNRNFLNFMSFQFRHMQQYGGWVRDIANDKSGRRTQSAQALAAYTLMNGILYGGKATIPAPIYHLVKAADKDVDKQINSVLGPASKGIVGATTGLDLGENAQPFGGVAFGVGTELLNKALNAGETNTVKGLKQAAKGRPDKLAPLIIDGAVSFSQLFVKGANAFTQKIVSGVTKAYIDDHFTPEGVTTEVEKKFFGQNSVKKAN